MGGVGTSCSVAIYGLGLTPKIKECCMHQENAKNLTAHAECSKCLPAFAWPSLNYRFVVC